MNKKILAEIYAYKYNGDYLKNYSILISVIKKVADNLGCLDLRDIGIHLVIESRNHRWGMAFSKGFEMATDLMDEIKEETENLIKKLPEEVRPALSWMNQEIPMHRSQLDKNPNDNWILIAQSWEFYILETANSSSLFVNDFEDSLQAEIPTDEYFNWKIKNADKAPYELIYSKINEWKLKNWMKKACVQQCI